MLVNRIGNRFNDPEVGEIVVFHPPAGAEDTGTRAATRKSAADQACDRPTPRRRSVNFIKRVVGLPGRHARRSTTAT